VLAPSEVISFTTLAPRLGCEKQTVMSSKRWYCGGFRVPASFTVHTASEAEAEELPEMVAFQGNDIDPPLGKPEHDAVPETVPPPAIVPV